METTPRDPRLLRHGTVERARRSDQRPPRTPARHRPGLPEPDPLHLAVPDPLRPTPRTHQRTLKPGEPRKRVTTTDADQSARRFPDLIGRDFSIGEPGLRYVGDITYLPIADGTNLFLSTCIDLGLR